MTSYKVLPEVSYRNVGDEVFLLNRNESSVYNLNATAAYLFKEIQTGKTVEEVVSDFCSLYDVDFETAHKDLMDLIHQLVNKKMIVPVDL